MDDFRFEALTPGKEAAWDDFCARNRGAWFWQTVPNLKLVCAYKPSVQTEPRHFLVYQRDRLVAICPLAKEKKEAGGKTHAVFMMGGDYLPSPVAEDSLSDGERERVLSGLFREVDRLARAEGIAKAAFKDTVLSPGILSPATAPENPFPRHGYMEASLRTRVVDLRGGEKAMWPELRKAYHSLIHRAEEAYSVRVLDARSVTEDSFRAYQLLHHKAAGRVTRPQITFDMMGDWIRQGTGLLIQALDGRGAVVGCVYASLYKGMSYYYSGCNDPDLNPRHAVGHLLIWNMMKELAARGATHLELGWQMDGPAWSHAASPKEAQISFFKRGFGGFNAPFYRAEKYYSEEFFRAEALERLESVARALSSAGAGPGASA